MRRRKVLGLGGGAARLWDGWLAGRPHRLLQCEKSKLKIDGLRLARTRAKRPAPRINRRPAPGTPAAWK